MTANPQVQESEFSSPPVTGARAAYCKALAAFQAELPHVGKSQTANTGTYSYEYADLGDIVEAASPLLAKHGLSFSSHPTMTDAGFVLHYELAHSDGHGESGDYPLPDPVKFSSQQIGSAITYGRRYCLCAVTNIAPKGEDDDGAKAQGATAQAPRPRQAGNGHASADDPAVLRAQIAAVGKAKGLGVDAISEDFAACFGGVMIGSASAEQLREYKALLDKREPAATP